MLGHQRHRYSIVISNDAWNLKVKAMFAQGVLFWGLFWGLCMTTGLSLLALLLASCSDARLKARGVSSFKFSFLLGLSKKNLQMKCCFAEDFNGSAPPLIFACPTPLPSISPLLSFLCLFPASALRRTFQSKNLNGYPPVTQPKSTLCFVPFR